MNKVYVVEHSGGEYSDRWSYIVCAFTDADKAAAFVNEKNEAENAERALNEVLSEMWLAHNETFPPPDLSDYYESVYNEHSMGNPTLEWTNVDDPRWNAAYEASQADLKVYMRQYYDNVYLPYCQQNNLTLRSFESEGFSGSSWTGFNYRLHNSHGYSVTEVEVKG